MLDVEDAEQDRPGPRQLSKGQRRVLGVLVEKGLTTPDQYPLTIKALTAGCNQKSNRDPVTNYSEEAVADCLDELRQLGLAAVVHTESGRTERFRHYMRKRYPFTESQLAIVTELLLRGRQQPGELRSRASRMAAIDSLEQLRSDLQSLQEQGFIQSSGGLERRGVEVDHTFYLPTEDRRLESLGDEDQDAAPAPAARSERPVGGATASGESGGRIDRLEATCDALRREKQALADDVEALTTRVEELASELADLRRALGA